MNAHLAQQVSTVLAMDLKNQLDLVMQASIAVEELALLHHLKEVLQEGSVPKGVIVHKVPKLQSLAL